MSHSNHSTEKEGTHSDRAIERENLARKIRELGGFVPEPKDGEVTDLELDFLKRVIAWETGASSTHRDWLARRGFAFAPPGALQGAELEQELWRLIEALAVARVFIENADHLSDEKLYRRLWDEVLDQDTSDMARTPADACHLDLCEPFADSAAWLTYYADDDEREEWAEEFPEVFQPARRPPPYARDQRLPKWR